jgi:hypothetical protein
MTGLELVSVDLPRARPLASRAPLDELHRSSLACPCASAIPCAPARSHRRPAPRGRRLSAVRAGYRSSAPTSPAAAVHLQRGEHLPRPSLFSPVHRALRSRSRKRF